MAVLQTENIKAELNRFTFLLLHASGNPESYRTLPLIYWIFIKNAFANNLVLAIHKNVNLYALATACNRYFKYMY